MLAQVRGGVLDRPVPAEAEVAVPGPNGVGGPRVRLAPRPVDVQLLLAKAICEAAVLELDELGAQHIAVEAVRPLPVADRNYAVVETNALSHFAAAGFTRYRKPIRFGGQ